MNEITAGIYRWTAPHPTWRSTVEEVVSYALIDGDVLAVIDPQLPPENDARRPALLAQIDGLVKTVGRLEILITIPYHTRSAETLYERYWSTVPTRISGHGTVKKRLTRRAPLSVIPAVPAGQTAEVADGLALALAIGRPRRSETPLYFPGLRAVAFGDAVVGAAGGLRLWNQNGAAADWYHGVFAPTLRPLLDLEVDTVLVTHGAPVVGEGRRALVECLAAAPVSAYWSRGPANQDNS